MTKLDYKPFARTSAPPEHEGLETRLGKAAARSRGGHEWRVKVYDDEKGMSNDMRAVKLSPTNVQRPIVMAGEDRRRVVFCLFSPAEPHTSSMAVADVVASLVSSIDGDDTRVVLDMANMTAGGRDHVLALLTRVSKACFRIQHVESSRKAGRRQNSAVLHFAVPPSVPALELQRRMECMYMASAIENAPANHAAPETVAGWLSGWFKKLPGVDVRILRQRDLVRERMNLVNAVGAGAASPPCVLVLRKRFKPSGKVVALLGKGVVYDSGGLSIKTWSGMYGMHGDKSGAAVAAAVFHHAVAHMDVTHEPYNVGELVAIIPLVENAVSGSSMRPNDVYTAANGKTVEIVDTDAEGRLILADALAYSARHKPDVIIDFATLTGTGELMHPDIAACYFTPSETLHAAVERAADATGERCWRMPKWTEDAMMYVQSNVADLKNAGFGAQADGYLAALFMHQFVPEGAEWVHIDVSKNQVTSGGPFVGTCVQLGIELVKEVGRDGAKKTRARRGPRTSRG
jgi:leucyl aminopeptidase